MILEFFNTNCTEPNRIDVLFGICDDQDGKKAYTNVTNRENWIATVRNEDQKSISFTALDNCVEIKKPNKRDKESICDGMLTFEESLFLIELKIQGTGGWESKAIDQLENTIKILTVNSYLKNFRYKKAFACNKKYPYFHYTDNERNLMFFRKYGFRIHVGTEISI